MSDDKKKPTKAKMSIKVKGDPSKVVHAVKKLAFGWTKKD
jgi:hypothetical protein